jgi:hypothetical protein
VTGGGVALCGSGVHTCPGLAHGARTVRRESGIRFFRPPPRTIAVNTTTPLHHSPTPGGRKNGFLAALGICLRRVAPKPRRDATSRATKVNFHADTGYENLFCLSFSQTF